MKQDFFRLIKKDKNTEARLGEIYFVNGQKEFSVKTPIFMPVGTRGSVKAIWQDDLEAIGYKLILGNTYHLYLRPGEVIYQLGGLKKFISWDYAILTDSGGFQVYSLSKIRQFHEDGIIFQSYLDGSKHFFTPENVIDFQLKLNSDIMMVLDDCPPANSDIKRIEESLQRTHKWAKRSIEFYQELQNKYQYTNKIFGIVQGGIFEEKRMESLLYIESLGFDGIAVGGLSVGENKEDFYRIVEFIGPKINPNKIHYLMGVGNIKDLLRAVKNGFDIFDCVLPTRNARHGHVFTSLGKLNIKNAQYKLDESALDPECNCKVCRRYSRAYIRHLYQMQELLAFEMLTYHNLYFYFRFFELMRNAIEKDEYENFFNYWNNFEW